MQSKIKNRQCIIGDNAFMAIVRCDDPDALQKEFAQQGVETATHFKNAITWAKEFVHGRMTLKDIMASYKIKHESAVWSWQDPLLAVVYVLLSPILYIKRH